MFERVRFLGVFGNKEAQGLADDFTKFVVGLDPATASAAELEMIETHLREIDGKLAQAEQAAAQDAKETAAAQATVDQYMAAADILQAKVAAGQAPEASLATLMNSLEKAVATLETDKQHDAQSQAFVGQLRETHDMMANKLSSSKEQLKDAQRALQTAQLEKERAEDRAQQAREAAGLSQTAGKLNIALSAMQEKAQKAQADARAAELTAGALKPTAALDADPAIAAALSQASNPQGSMSAADRLAAIKAKMGK